MPKPVMLDASPLGRLAHPRPHTDVSAWLNALLANKIVVIVPEITDYEVRRNLLVAGLHHSLIRLNELKSDLIYQPITTAIMLKAAELWADARRRGRSTADPKELDADVILAAQAIEVDAIVATENAGHLARYVTAEHWRSIIP